MLLVLCRWPALYGLGRELEHPNILTVYDAGTTPDGVHYIAMEYAPGGTLRDLLERGPLTAERAAELAAQVADALHAAHRHGIVHRDLKPSNILISRAGRPLLMDFGVAQVRGGTRLTRTGVTAGTPEYMSPEQAQGLAVDERSDVYALEVMLFEMVTGEVPYSGQTPLATLYRQLHDMAPPLNAIRDDLPVWLADIVEKARAKQQQERFGNAVEMAAALRAGPQGAAEAVARPAAARAPISVPVPAYPTPPPAPSVATAGAPQRKGAAAIWVLAALMAVALVADGQVVGNDYAFAKLNNLPAGEKTCFTTFFASPPAIYWYQFEVSSFWT